MNLSPLPIQKFFDNNGRPLAGGLLFTYAAGTSTKIATYVDSTGVTPNTNPIVLNFRGECRLWIDPTLAYKFILSPANDTDPPTNPIAGWPVDNITAAPAQLDNSAVDTGSVNNVSLSIPQISSPVAFTRIVFTVANTNTGATTISINGGTAKNLMWQHLAAFVGGEIVANGIYEAVYDGAQWQIQSPTLQPPQQPTPAENAASVVPTNRTYFPGDLKRHGALSSNTTVQNRTSLQSAISANSREGSTDGVLAKGGAVVVVPADINWGYDIDNPADWPSFAGATAPITVLDYGPGDSYAGYPTAYDGAQIRMFFYTPQTTATRTFTGSLLAGATSATLSSNWTGLTGRWPVTFSNGDQRDITFTNGATTATWTSGLSSSATASFTYVNPGQHVGNTLLIRADWPPGIFISNDANLAAVGNPARLAYDNRRAQLSFGNDGLEGWKVGQGTLAGPGFTNEELSNWALQKVALPGDTLGSFGVWIIERKTLNQSFGAATNVPPASFHFNSAVTGFYQAMFENTFDTESSILLRNNVGLADDCGVANKAGILTLFIRALGDALLVAKTNRRVTIAKTLTLHQATLTYSASMTIDAADGNLHIITATNGTAFTINAPTNAVIGTSITVTIRNASGGALGAATWNAIFKMSAWTQPANANSRSITFRYDHTNWIEISRTTADVPN